MGGVKARPGGAEGAGGPRTGWVGGGGKGVGERGGCGGEQGVEGVEDRAGCAGQPVLQWNEVEVGDLHGRPQLKTQHARHV